MQEKSVGPEKTRLPDLRLDRVNPYGLPIDRRQVKLVFTLAIWVWGTTGAGWLAPELVIGSSCGMHGRDITDTIDNNECI